MGRLDIPRISKGFFATIMPFRTEEGRARYDAADFRRTIQEVLAAQEAAAGARRVDFEIYEDAKYAMVGLVDELAIVSDWSYRNDWAQEPLELAIFNSNVAGDDFFERLAKLRARYSNSRNEEERETVLGALEVFFTCLECGFKGRFRGGSEGEMESIRTGLLTMLWPDRDSRQHKPLFPEAYGEGGRATAGERSLNRWPMIVLLALVLLVGVYLVYSFLLGGRAGDIQSAINNHAVDTAVEEISK